MKLIEVRGRKDKLLRLSTLGLCIIYKTIACRRIVKIQYAVKIDFCCFFFPQNEFTTNENMVCVYLLPSIKVHKIIIIHVKYNAMRSRRSVFSSLINQYIHYPKQYRTLV